MKYRHSGNLLCLIAKWFFLLFCILLQVTPPPPPTPLVYQGNCLTDGERFAWKWQALGILHEIDKPSPQPPQPNCSIVCQFLLVYTFALLAFWRPSSQREEYETDLSRARLTVRQLFSWNQFHSPVVLSVDIFFSFPSPLPRICTCQHATAWQIRCQFPLPVLFFSPSLSLPPPPLGGGWGVGGLSVSVHVWSCLGFDLREPEKEGDCNVAYTCCRWNIMSVCAACEGRYKNLPKHNYSYILHKRGGKQDKTVHVK